MSTQDVFTPQEAETLLALDEEALTELLGLRVNAIQQDVSLSLQPTFKLQGSTLEAFTMPPWIKKTVDAMIITALRQSHKVLCSDLPEFKDLRANLVGALGLGGSAAVIALAAFLTGTLGIAAALATVLATIVIKKIGGPMLKAGHQTLCAELAKLLPD
jgi:ABC-type dipeptide/oligopeptide/nickel transport system ATPase component